MRNDKGTPQPCYAHDQGAKSRTSILHQKGYAMNARGTTRRTGREASRWAQATARGVRQAGREADAVYSATGKVVGTFRPDDEGHDWLVKRSRLLHLATLFTHRCV